MVDPMIRYNITILPFHSFCVTQSSADVLHAPDLTSPYMTGYALDYTEGALQQQVKLTFYGHLFTRLVFTEYSCCLGCNIYSWLCRDYGLILFG